MRLLETGKRDFCSKGFSSLAGTCYGVAPQLTCMPSMQMDVQAGVGYGIVVDGFAGKFGTYQITISAAQVLFIAHTALPTKHFQIIVKLSDICTAHASALCDPPPLQAGLRYHIVNSCDKAWGQ